MAEEGKNPKGEINNESNSANTGMNMDLTPSQIPKGALTYALNAALENYDANGINYQNEPGNEFCLEFPMNYVLIGSHFIQERSKHIFFLANPLTGQSEIGYMDNNDCIYKTLINAACLNFNVNFPIPKIVHRVTNCTTEIYWPDQNGRRYLDIDNIPFVLSFGSDICNPVYSDVLDCNQLNIQPNFAIPEIEVIDVRNGGNIIAGTVQFAFQYSDALGNGYTSYYSVTNPTPIADPSLITVNFNYPVGKSVVIEVSNIELSGKFKYFNIAVIKTVNDITSVELVGTFPIVEETQEITYSGQSVANIRLSINDIFEKFPTYGPADDVTTVQDVLVWKGLTSEERINYQSIASKIKLQWETWRLPPGEDYADELNATNFRGYLRDEVYAFEFVPILRSGKQADAFHIPGREMFAIEETYPTIPNTDDDYIEDPDQPSAPYWKIYNTATNLGKSPGYSPAIDYKGPYEYGEFAFWESGLEYPCDEKIWGELAGQKIRHHKFPDVPISPIFESGIFAGIDNLIMADRAIFPIGVKISIQQVKELISNSNLTKEQKADIVGFKIARGNRGTNKSIIAKGILRNVGKYEREEQAFYFPNYPYNDLNEDPFINLTNNAYPCKTYDINIYKLNVPASGGAPGYTEIMYTDCNSNKTATKKYYLEDMGTAQKICSVHKPTLVGPGIVNEFFQTSNGPVVDIGLLKKDNTVTITLASYDRYMINPAYAGFRCLNADYRWYDWTEVLAVSVNGSTILVHAQIDSDIPICFDNCAPPDGCAGAVTYMGRVNGDTCSSVKPLPVIKDSPELAYRQIFNSPETSFAQPFLGDILKLESVMYGEGRAHFVEVKDNAKYRLLTKEAQQDALASAQIVGGITDPANAAAMFTVYQAYLTIYINGITRKNYAYSFNSIANYDYTVAVPNDMGIKQRPIDLKRYLIPVVQNVGEQNININNYQRETSVYLRTKGSVTLDPAPLPFPDKSPYMLAGPNISEYSRFTVGCAEDGRCVPSCDTPAKEQDIQVVSYYASIKNIFREQWGQLYSYETIDTGFQQNLSPDSSSEATFFGGDTFITRFAFKTKVPFFIDNRVGAPDDSEIFYDELGNIGYPKYWHSARSILEDYYVSGLGTLTNIISYKAHNFDCPNSQDVPTSNPNRTFYDGIFYLFAYGIPNFYVESSYNVDLRQAFNNKEGEFWPHVSTGIPDDWVQESFVSIQNDNTYNYNVTYSKQNKENYFSHLPADWSDKKCFTVYPFRAIYSEHETSDADNRVNSWLTYKPTSFFDFPQNYGRLTSIDGIENRQLLARFENKSLLFNALYTNQINTGGQVYLGQPLFDPSSPPFDYAETDLGYMGSQNKFLLKVPQGQVTIDAKRGQVFLIQGHNIKDLSAPGSGMNRFFTDHLAFEILRFFPSYEITDPVTKERTTVPGVNTDNNFKDIGLHGVYDSKYDRVIITKLDYIPIDSRVKYDYALKEFYIETEYPQQPVTTTSTSSSTSSTTSSSTTASPTTSTSTTRVAVIRTRVELTDPAYFCNKSWTLSYSFITNSWISFHSYLPNWYIGENNFFYSGIKTCCTDEIDFDFIAGPLVPDPSTTTTTSSSTSSTSSTTTTTTTLSCALIGGTVIVPACDLAGTAVITIPPFVPCTRPNTVIMQNLITGYNIIAPPSSVTSTASSAAACNAITFINANLSNTTPIILLGLSLDLNIGATIYANNGTDDCTTIPDGWYFINSSLSSGRTFHVVSGIITAEVFCFPATTTTTTTGAAVQSFKATIDVGTTGTIFTVLPNFYTLNSGNAYPVSSGTITGVVNSGGTSLSIKYTSFDTNPIMIIYKNAVPIINTAVPSGTDITLGFSISWLSTDMIEVVLTKL